MPVVHLQLIQILPREWAARWPQYLTFQFCTTIYYSDRDILPLGIGPFCRMTIDDSAGRSDEFVLNLRKYQGFSAAYPGNLLLFEQWRTQAVGRWQDD